MPPTPPKPTSRLRTLRGAALIATLAVAALAGCSVGGASPSPSTSAAVDTVKDLDFAQPGGTPLQLDACTPKDVTGDLPAVVIVHSGAWSEGSHGDLDWLCAEGARHGFAAFTVDYRLLPNAFPSQLEDVVSAVDWISANAQAKRFHVDRSRVALLGTSAGAGIVSELLTGVPGSPVEPSRFIGGAMLSGIYDFPAIVASTTDPTEQRVPLDYAGCSSTDCSRLDDVSAAKHVDAKDPPMFLANSTTELVPLAQATTMAAALHAAGVRHELEVATTGTDHAEFIVMNHRDIDAKMWRFLQGLAG